MALGCDRRGILGWVYRRGAVLLALGIAFGVLGSLASTRFVSALLFGVTPTDAGTLAAVAMGLGLVGGLACYVPARRDFAFCPQCGSPLPRACPGCRRPVEPVWPHCAHCGQKLLGEPSGSIPTSPPGS